MKHRIVNILITVAAILAVGFAGLAMWTVFTTDRGEAPQIAGISMLRVISGSMEPEIPSGSVIFVKEQSLDTWQNGDVISFYSRDPAIGGEINTHRIVDSGIDENGKPYFITKGDANQLKDAYAVYGEDIVGKVIFCSKLFGKFVDIAASKYGYIFVVLIPILIIFIINIKDLIHIFRRAVDEELENMKDEESAKEASILNGMEKDKR